MRNALRLVPNRWFVPREALRRREGAGQSVDDIDRFFQGLFQGMLTPWGIMRGEWASNPKEGDALTPCMDLTSSEKGYALSMELPGVAPENVDVSVQDRELVVSGEKQRETTEENENSHVTERVFGSFKRMLILPEDADVNSITANHKDGVLTVCIPRKPEALPETKKIEITKG
ncbi:MAG: Hsp20/alpha crystallin family protein [Desulfovibrio desulfuricans]|nr:Hsp20/alpha crystallin family protein [Desulfovibrio desulfuricans]